MKIPDGPSGFPTVSPTQLRTYGAGGFRLEEHEAERGCPRQYQAKYVDKRVPDRGQVYELDYGSLIHNVLFRMEEHGEGPEEALDKEFPAWMPPEAYREALDDLHGYLERGSSPMDRFGTVGVEEHLDAELYVDEEFGPIHMRGFVDWLGIDLDDPRTLHVVDYKTNRHPPSTEDVRGDVQLKTYHWLAMKHAERWGIDRVVVHLDAIKWREVEVAFTPQEIEDWHGWAVAVVRAILRDEEAAPVVNPGCAWCPVKDDCPAFLGLPQVASSLSENLAGLEDPAEKLRWRDAANAVRLLLEKAVAAIDKEFADRARALPGGLVIGDTRWALDTEWSTEIDLLRLHEVLGDRFYEVVATSESKLKTLTKDWTPEATAAVLGCVSRVPSGSKVKKGKVS